MKRLEITEPAEAEYRDAAAWYRDRDSRVADRFVVETRRTLELIESFPQIGGRVVFVDLADHLEVVAFAHYRRRPGYFVDRLRRT